MSTAKRILITGATGKQGGALLSALLESPPTTPPPFHLIALTRNANSPKAQALSRHPNVSVLEGDLNDTPAIFANLPDNQPLHGVFSVQTPLKPHIEEKQGKSLISAAAAHGVRHFVYTSADRGGPDVSDRESTQIKHFLSKFNIENHLKQTSQAATRGAMQYTIIRPVAFMDNLTPDFLGRAFMGMWRLNGPDEKLQLVSARDIGALAADIFTNPERYTWKAVSLATDEISPRQADQIFQRVVGTDVPSSYPLTARIIKWLLHEQLGMMFDWFKTDGFGADPVAMRRSFPQMLDFETWLREESGWRTKTREA